MILNVTLLTERTIYQSADFRLTNADSGATVTGASTHHRVQGASLILKLVLAPLLRGQRDGA